MELLAAAGRAPAAAGKKPPPSRTRQPPCGAEPGGVGAVEIPPGSCFFSFIFFNLFFGFFESHFVPSSLVPAHEDAPLVHAWRQAER